MNKISKKHIGLFILIALLVVVTVLAIRPDGASAVSAPTVHVQFGDDQDHSPDVPEDCYQHVNPPSGPGPSATDNEDPDCLRVKITNPADAVFTEDFRFCLRHSSGTRICTLYASQIGSTPSYSQMVSAQNNGTLDGTVTAEIETRPSSGVSFRNVSVAVSLAYQEDNGPCTASGGIYWASQGSTSGWAYSPRDNDPGCFQVGLFTSPVPSYDADYISTTLPVEPQVVNPNTSYSGTITMKNTGNVAGDWPSDRIVSHSNPACQQDPIAHPSTCVDTVTYTSTIAKLMPTEQSSIVAVPADGLTYTRTATTTYASRRNRICTEFGKASEDQHFNIFEIFINKALARSDCTFWEYTFEWETVSQTGTPNVPANTEEEFNITITTPAAPGTYHLKYKMVNGPGAWFGDEVDLIFVVRPTDGLYGTLAGPHCVIPAGGNSCNTTITWSVENNPPPVPAGSTSRVTSSYPSASYPIGTGHSGSAQVSIPYPSRDFYLYNSSQPEPPLAYRTINATCAEGSTWNGSICYSIGGGVNGNGTASLSIYDVEDINGGWGQCSVSCGGGLQYCDNPAPSGNGAPCPGGPSPRACNTQACTTGGGVCAPTHYICTRGTPGSQVNGTSSWTWTCTDGTPPVSTACSELKKKPIFIEN